VIKAFNTTFAGTLSARKVGPITTTVLVAGDDAEAKAALIEAVKAGGVEAIDEHREEAAHRHHLGHVGYGNTLDPQDRQRHERMGLEACADRHY
jgi:predicted dinucleotide-binding enzyme